MPDIHIRRGYRGSHLICALSERGRRWLLVNMLSISSKQLYGIPIASEYAEEIAQKIREDDLDVEVD